MNDIFSAAVLAGGKSIRLGRNTKAFVEIGGETIMGRTLSALRPLFKEITIIGSQVGRYASFGVPVFTDCRPGQGSLGGILTALHQSSTPKVFCAACDMPFLHPAVVQRLLEEAGEEWEVAIPRLKEGLEPLCAVYSTSLARSVEALLDRGEKRIRFILDEARVRYVEEEELRAIDPGLRSFFNINTPEDLEEARKIAASVIRGHDT